VVTILAWDNNRNKVGEGCGLALADNLIAIPYHLFRRLPKLKSQALLAKDQRLKPW